MCVIDGESQGGQRSTFQRATRPECLPHYALNRRGMIRMAKYLLEVRYTLDGAKGVKAHGGSARRDAAAAAATSAGGTLESFHFAFGEVDAYVVADFPDNTTAAALALAVTAAGGASVRTIPLLTPAEMDAAAAKTVGYRPPGS